jgi:ribokinase
VTRIFVVGSLNLDLVVRVDRVPRPGETRTGSDLSFFCGGKGANQACAAARLGGNVTMVGQVGEDAFGPTLLDGLRQAGVDASGVGVVPRSSGSALIAVTPEGENSIIVSPGANAALDPHTARSRLQALAAGDLLLVQLETPLETVAAVLKHARARGATAILDPAPARSLPAEVLRHVDILTPNETEAAALCREVGLDAGQTAARLLALGPATVILKSGSQGCYVAGGEGVVLVPGISVKAVDTTAAGDTFNGALALALSEGRDLLAAARFANAAAAISVTRPGAQSSIPDRPEVEALLCSSSTIWP